MLYRLTSAIETYAGPPAEVIASSYEYDAAGNRLALNTDRSGDLVAEYEYNSKRTAIPYIGRQIGWVEIQASTQLPAHSR